MIFCATKPIKEYSDEMEGGRVGLSEYYAWNPAMLNLILLTTIAGYDYEGETMKPIGNKINNFSEEYDEIFKGTIDCEVDGMPVKEMLETLNPVEIYQKFNASDIDHLPICQRLGTDKVLQLVMTRVTAWAVSYRGQIKQQGNVKTVAFGDSSEMLGVTQEMVGFYTAFKKALVKVAA